MVIRYAPILDMLLWSAKKIIVPLFVCVTWHNHVQAATLNLTVVGTTSGTGETTTLNEPGTGSNGDVNWGNINTINPIPATGKGVRVSSNKSARLVASLSANVSGTGYSSYTLTVQRSDGMSTVPNGRLRVNSGNTTNWSASSPGTVLNASPTVLLIAAANNTTIIHEFATELHDKDPAGSKSVQVSYTLTGNP